MLDGLWPEAISQTSTLFLIVFSALTSAITASLGAGGGVLLLAVMAMVLPPAVIIPVHGIVQLGSNFNRAIMTIRDLNWHHLSIFALGSIIGAWLASRFLVQLPLQTTQLTIAALILFLCWGPAIPNMALGKLGSLVAAIITTFISMFAGATGPLVGAFVKQQYQGDRAKTVANFSAAMTVQHLPKTIVFGASGFVFQDWIALIVLMIVSGAVGTWIGLKLAKRLSNQNFGTLFNIVLTLLALRLVWQAWTL
ncbi:MULTISPECIES: sulfite exporter TauE/SafE family protein [Vitreoscilla]|uniref:Probable membrane transporter protein n=1 Tax=Vitreoscilla stercoraria TaxID=61 RepID=A0ABY4EBF8_VITST|nr:MULTISPECIES: sulfite exporter TauE/SafE family protein [Vitreoscilla]AUZ05502.1 putative sulfite exporter TauE/SafE [Vitreoscilla sp. C1]UOO93083.1 sulfite exporter TauE/SafE family protein [Vitreoscilla stercoraria]